MPLNESIALSREKKSSNLEKSDTFTLHHAPHLDVFKWVARDSYLPQGSQGLKEVTRIKLQYQPVEVAPEEMVEKALKEAQVLLFYFFLISHLSRLWQHTQSLIQSRHIFFISNMLILSFFLCVLLFL
jgi:hypothetical protein